MPFPVLVLALTLLQAPADAEAKSAPAATVRPAHGGMAGHYGQRADVRDWVDAQTAPGAPLAGLDRDRLRAQLAGAQYRADAAQLMMPAPVGQAKDWATYRDRFVEPRRLQAGLRFWEQNAEALQRAEAQYGVPASVIMGILGVESFYGQIMGNFRVIDALATLAFDFPGGRSDRTPFFREQLAELLLLAQAEGRDPAGFKGSFAGAIGLGQFMPGSWRAYAVDFDGDGHIDLSANAADAIGSIANYLRQHGWQAGVPSHLFTEAPADTEALARLLVPDIDPTWDAAALQAAGIRTELPHPGPWALIKLENGNSAPPSYVLGSRNFYVVTRYNRSSYYAMAVLTLGERVAALRRAGQ